MNEQGLQRKLLQTGLKFAQKQLKEQSGAEEGSRWKCLSEQEHRQ